VCMRGKRDTDPSDRWDRPGVRIWVLRPTASDTQAMLTLEGALRRKESRADSPILANDLDTRRGAFSISTRLIVVGRWRRASAVHNPLRVPVLVGRGGKFASGLLWGQRHGTNCQFIMECGTLAVVQLSQVKCEARTDEASCMSVSCVPRTMTLWD
jgi:hypothetical protein